jgi:hypothetical protein
MRPEHGSKEPAGSVSSSAHVGRRVQRQRESLPRTPLLASWVNGLECDKEALTKSSENTSRIHRRFIQNSLPAAIDRATGRNGRNARRGRPHPYVVRS